jgi:hypothetical protein
LFFTSNVKDYLQNHLPVPLLLYFSALLALYLKDFKISILCFTIFFSVEALIGIVEYILEVRSIFTLETFNNFGSNKYFLSAPGVFGLSDGSSSFAFKMLLLILLAKNYIGFKFRYYIISLAFIGIIVSSNKTVLIGAVLYFFVDSFKNDFTLLYFKYTFIGIFGVATFLLILLIYNGGELINTILTGRIPIYKGFVSFINENILFGNSFSSARILTGKGKVIHAHNSFFQLLADNGILYTSLFLFFINRKINFRNYLSILILFICSLVQHYLFWGVYHGDVLFFILLFKSVEDSQEFAGNLSRRANVV